MKLTTAKRKLREFHLSLGVGIVFLMICVGAMAASNLLRTNAYNSFISISPSTQMQTKRNTYLRAIRLSPEKPDAYLLLLDAYNEDGAFSKEESEEFLSIYNSNHSSLNPRAEEYEELHYKAGFLYINGYDGSTPTRLRMALPFLEEAREGGGENGPHALAVQCYCRIGAYYRDYIWDASSSVREVSPTEMTALMEDIQQTLAAFETDTSAEAVFNRLGFCEAVCNLLYDQRDILAATVPRETVEAVLNQVYAELPEMQLLQKEQTKTLLQSLLDNEDTYRSMVERAYERKGEP